MTPLPCSALDPLAAGHALGSLDPGERAFFAAHLACCRRPHPALRESLAVAGAIGEALAAPCGPSDSLRAALLGAVRAEPRQADIRRDTPSSRRAASDSSSSRIR